MKRGLLAGIGVILFCLIVFGSKAEATTLGSRTVKFGHRGYEVAELQNRLQELGYSIGRIDGVFGSKTESGVKKLQADRGLLTDGIVGKLTWKALYGEDRDTNQPNLLSRGANGVPFRYSKLLVMTATAYSPEEPALKKWGGITYTGVKAKKGIVAVDPKVIPLGTKLYVEDYGYVLAADTGSAIKGNRIDLCYETLAEMNSYHHWRKVKVYILD
jgi:3D (Asp-Asp-Asp) domain-containing protein